MAYRLSITDSQKLLPSNIKTQFASITKGMDDTVFFGDDTWNGSSAKQFISKISKDNFEKALKSAPDVATEFESKMQSGRRVINFQIDAYKFQFQESSKRPGAPDGGTTQQQELASLWMVKRALGTPSRIYKDVADLKSDKNGFNELVKIYPDLETNTKWVEGLIAQQKTVGQKLKAGNYNEFNREGGFMDFITNLVKTKFDISKKDSWNPADIWVVRDEAAVIRDINKAVEGTHPSIQELNGVMRRMWADKRLKGISLKAVSGKQAKWEEVNVDEMLFTESNKPTIFEFKEAMIKLDLKPTNQFQSQDTIIRIGEGTNIEYKFQVKANSRGYSNLKFEPTQSGAGAARLGKVPLDMLKTLLRNDYNIAFKNNNAEFPKTRLEFEKKQDVYASMWEKVNRGGAVTNVKTKEEFKENMKTVFTLEPDVANSKLMQLQFLNDLYALDRKKQQELLTNMVFLAMKKGQYFGPFGKLY